MVKGNWLVGYKDIIGIHAALTGMSSRTPYVSKMDEASQDLREHYENFKREFEQFFPELKTFAENWLHEG